MGNANEDGKVIETQHKVTTSMLMRFVMKMSSVATSLLFHKNVHGQTVCLEGSSRLNYVRCVVRNIGMMYVRLNGSTNRDCTIKIYANFVFLVQMNLWKTIGYKSLDSSTVMGQ